jgi:hypothetical protein
LKEDRLIVKVEDRGRWRQERADGGGRGMAIMRGTVDHVAVLHGQGGTKVRFELLLQTAPSVAPRVS